ncbi:MAG: hypothetical protein WDM76_07650, partial [Limisphaerales bacterium]
MPQLESAIESKICGTMAKAAHGRCQHGVSRPSNAFRLVLTANSGRNTPMTIRRATFGILIALAVILAGCATRPTEMNQKFEHYVLDYKSPVDAKLQAELEAIDANLRGKYGMTSEQTAVGLLDLKYIAAG